MWTSVPSNTIMICGNKEISSELRPLRSYQLNLLIPTAQSEHFCSGTESMAQIVWILLLFYMLPIKIQWQGKQLSSSTVEEDLQDPSFWDHELDLNTQSPFPSYIFFNHKLPDKKATGPVLFLSRTLSQTETCFLNKPPVTTLLGDRAAASDLVLRKGGLVPVPCSLWYEQIMSDKYGTPVELGQSLSFLARRHEILLKANLCSTESAAAV